MDWNDPDNFDFAFRVACMERKRIKAFYLRYYVGFNQLYQSPRTDVWYWAANLPFAPAHTWAGWLPEVWPLDQQFEVPIPGPAYQTVPGGYWFQLNSNDPITAFQFTLLGELIQAGQVPLGTTWMELSQAVRDQTIGLDPYGPPQGMLPGISNWRSGWAAFLNDRKKLLWERPQPTNPYDKWWLGFGRTPPDVDFASPGRAYRDEVWWLEPLAETYKVWRIPCGRRSCCCCCC